MVLQKKKLLILYFKTTHTLWNKYLTKSWLPYRHPKSEHNVWVTQQLCEALNTLRQQWRLMWKKWTLSNRTCPLPSLRISSRWSLLGRPVAFACGQWCTAPLAIWVAILWQSSCRRFSTRTPATTNWQPRCCTRGVIGRSLENHHLYIRIINSVLEINTFQLSIGKINNDRNHWENV